MVIKDISIVLYNQTTKNLEYINKYSEDQSMKKWFKTLKNQKF